MKDYRKKEIAGHKLRPESLMMGYGYNPAMSEGALKTPLFQTSTFVFKTAEEGKAFFELAYGLREADVGEEMGLIYSRVNNPDLQILEERLTLWDGAEEGAVFDSGMAAISTSLMTFCRPGDVLLHGEPVYGGSDHLIKSVLPEFGIIPIGFPTGVPVSEIEAELREKIGKRRIAAAFFETPANPTLGLVDIRGIANFVHSYENDEHRPVVMVDNTFLGPVFQHPLKFGADLVVYSATKFIGGHSDVIAGAVLGSTKLMAKVKGMRTFMGTQGSPYNSWLLMRSLETLKLRMTAAMKNARHVVKFLKTHSKVQKVHYLGEIKESDPMFNVYNEQCESPGSLITFYIKGGEPEAFAFLNALQLIHLAVSLGGTESLIEHPASMTHSDISPENQIRMGITPAMVRLSVGVEHYEDIIADLKNALDHS